MRKRIIAESEFTAREKALIEEAKKDAEGKKKAFTPVDEL